MKKFLQILLFALPSLLFGQEAEQPQNFSFGLLAGFETQNLDWKTVPIGDGGRVWADRPKPGGSLGVFGSWRLANSVEFRSELAAAFTRNRLFFRAGDQTISRQDYRFADLELPAHLVFTNPKGRFPLRGSLLVGGRVSWDFAQKKPSGGLELYRERLALDLGAGVEMSLKKLKMRPEVIYSYGLNNVNDAVETPEYWAMGKTVRDRVSVRLLFYLK